ncbi:MAG: AAA family ATPase [Cyclobacteriaceae bacterium]|nr:AAA family ATPase [Cyclobacteriaceae bacterium]
MPEVNQVKLGAFQKDIEKHILPVVNEFDGDRITDESIIPPIIPVIEIGGSIFAAKGDLSIIGGLPKVGKTSVCAFMLATALIKDCAHLDTLSIRTSFSEGRPVVYVDTEQPKSYTDKLRRLVLKICGLSKEPSSLHIYNFRKYDSKEKNRRVFALMEQLPDAHLWIIDGVADLIQDPNDTREAFGIVEQLMIKSDQLNTTIVAHIHENPGTSGKLRGNLGSEAERKCGGAITIKRIKEKSIHQIEAKLIRGGPNFDDVFFRFDRELGMPVSLNSIEASEAKRSTDKSTVRLEKRIELAKRCLRTGALGYRDLVNAIVDASGEIEGKKVSQRTAESRVKELVELKMVVQNGDYYEFNPAHIPQP